jgi:hypothetical protein
MTIRRSVLIAASLLSFAVSADAALAATNPKTKECSDDWAKMKADNKVPTGMTWPKFLSQCSKDAADASGQGAAAPANPPKPTKTAAVKPAKSDAVDESDSSSSAADKKACDAKWGTYKASKGVHGWKAYFTFMAGCM